MSSLALLLATVTAMWIKQFMEKEALASELAAVWQLRESWLSEFESLRPTPILLHPTPSTTVNNSNVIACSWMPLLLFFLALMGSSCLLTIGRYRMTVLDHSMIRRRLSEILPDLQVGQSLCEDIEIFCRRLSEENAFMSTIRNRFSRATARYLARIAHLENEVESQDHEIADLKKQIKEARGAGEKQAGEIDHLRQKLADLEARTEEVGHLQQKPAEAVEACGASESAVSTVEEVVPQGKTEPHQRLTEAQPAADAKKVDVSGAAEEEVEDEGEEDEKSGEGVEVKKKKKHHRGKRRGGKKAVQGSSQVVEPPSAVETLGAVTTPTITKVVESPASVASPAAPSAASKDQIAAAKPPAASTFAPGASPAIQPRVSPLAAWASFGATEAKREADEAALLAAKPRPDVEGELQLPTFNETWRQVKMGGNGGNRAVVGASKSQVGTERLVPSPAAAKESSNEPTSRGSSSTPAPSRSQSVGTEQTIAPQVRHARPAVNLSPPRPKPTGESKGKSMAQSAWATKPQPSKDQSVNPAANPMMKGNLGESKWAKQT